MGGRGLARLARWLLAAIVIATIAYFVVGGWIVYRVIDKVLTVGATQPVADAAAPSHPFDLGYAGDPKMAFGFAFADVPVATELGPAPAWLVTPPAPAPGIAAIYVHGIGGRRENGYRALPVLHAAGVPALLISYRNDEGAPRSPDGRYQLGLTEWRDLDAAVSAMRQRGYGRLLLVAESMGGGIVGQWLIHSRQTAAVSGIVLEAPAIEPMRVTGEISQTIGFPVTGPLAQVALNILARRGGPDLRNASSEEAVARFPGALMMIHGTRDRLVPVEISDDLLRTRFGATTYLRTHADHLLSRAESPARYDAELLAFVRRVAGPPAAPPQPVIGPPVIGASR